MFGLLVFVLQVISSDLLQAMLNLLLWLQVSRNFTLTTRRDAYFALMVSLTLIVLSAAEARSGAFLFVMVAYGLMALGVLVYCHQQRGFDDELQQGAQVRTSGSSWSLSLRHLAALTGCVFLIALFWYLLVPRPAAINFGAVATSGGNKYSRSDWEREARKDLGKSTASDRDAERRHKSADSDSDTGLTKDADKSKSKENGSRSPSNDELDITRSSQGVGAQKTAQAAQYANRIVLYVQADRSLYLRTRTYDHFQNNRWSDTNNRTRKLLPEHGNFNLPSPDDGEKVEYVVQVVSTIDANLPLSAHPNSLRAPAEVIAQGPDGVVYLSTRIQPGFRYSAISLLANNSVRPVARDVPSDRSPYLQLPDGFSPRIGELAQQVNAAAKSPFDKAVALESHLRSAYAYSFETIFTSQNVTPLEDFLFVTRRGHCEFFASAMAMMLREIGIPSRVVHGYLSHSFNPLTGFYEVRTFDGHAWVEAYIDGVGWMTFEPTAAYPMPQRQMQTGSTLTDLKTYTGKLAKQEILQGKIGLIQSISELFRRLSEAWYLLLFYLQTCLETAYGWIILYSVPIIATISGLTLAAFVGYRQRVQLLWLWAKVVVRSTSARDIPLAAFQQLERVARTRELGRASSETIEEYLGRLENIYGELHQELRVLRRAFNAARYDSKKLNQAEVDILTNAFHAIGVAVTSRQVNRS